MRKILLLIIGCILVCAGAYRWGGTEWEKAKHIAIEQGYVQICTWMLPYIQLEQVQGSSMVYQDMEQMLTPAIASYRDTVDIVKVTESENVGQDDSEGSIENVSNSETVEHDEIKHEESVGDEDEEGTATETISPNVSTTQLQKQVEISRTKLQDFDYLRQNFYQIDNTTTIGSEMLDVNKLLGKDMSLSQNVEGPQILIYHTHSQECYADSVPGDTSTSVVALGDYLEVLLEEKYGIQVLHHKGQYDVEKRDSAYANALPDLEQILKDNPSIEVVIDLHRDGVADTTHLVTEINGKPTAQIMFFNGLSRTTAQGELSNLMNPYIEDNLAFSFQMQLAAAEYYPGFSRRIYLKGYRYNMHLCPKSLLVEVGAQTNTFQEAKNAMEPLADILAIVLTQEN